MATYKKKYKAKNKAEKEQNIEDGSTTAEVFKRIDETASKTEAFVAKNQKYIFIIIGIVAVVVLGSLAYKEYIAKPKQLNAMNDMFQAQKYFDQAVTGVAKDSLYNLALNGGEGKYCMLDIIEEYSGTPSANLASYYAGTAYLRLKDYKKIKESLRFIQKLRNSMAHWELAEKESTLEDIVIYTLVGKYRKITINTNLIKNFKKHINFLLKKFGYQS